MSSSPWTKIYWADLMMDTVELDHEEFSIYIHLLARYYKGASPLPDDLETLSRVAKTSTPQLKKKLKNVLEAHFIHCDGKWWNKRADKEIALRQKQAENGKKGGRPSFKVVG